MFKMTTWCVFFDEVILEGLRKYEKETLTDAWMAYLTVRYFTKQKPVQTHTWETPQQHSHVRIHRTHLLSADLMRPLVLLHFFQLIFS